MNILELFSGTESFAKVAREQGHTAFTVDIDAKFKPNLVKDVLLQGLPELDRRVGL